MPKTPVWEMTVDIRSVAADRDEARRALALLVDPDSAHELRGLPSGRSHTVHGNRLDAALDAVIDLADGKGTYITLNPVRPDLTGAAKVKDVLCRRWFLVDVDPSRPDRDSNASEPEKAAARGVLDAVRADLAARGWPDPVVIDSGNGWHLLYPIDLPKDKLAQQTLRLCLTTLQSAHGTNAAKVDTVTHNASRITKLPGTWVRKGPHTADRPHRLARLVSVPGAVTPVPLDLLRELAGLLLKEQEQPPAAPDVWTIPVPSSSEGDRSAYVRKALDAECGRVANAPEGERNNVLNAAAFNLGRLLHLGGVSREEAERALTFSAARAGLAEREIGPTVRSGLEAGEKEPRKPTDRPGRNGTGAHGPGFVPDASSEETSGHSGRLYKFPLIVRGSSVTPKKVDWLWPDRIPFGFLTLFAGRTGVGKSFVALDLAARLSAGDEVPLGAGLCFEPAAALIISEDSHEFILAPRLIEANADMHKVSFMSWEAMAAFTLADTQMLDDVYYASGAPKLVVIDPPTNFLGAKDEHKNAEVRGVLMGCSVWAMRHEVACLMITHCNKGTKKDIAALDRIIGSVAWASTSRIAHLLAPHPEGRGGVFLPLKSNIGEMPPGLAYAVTRTDTLARVEWLGEADVDADEAVSSGGAERKPRKVVASAWLLARMGERPEWASTELFAAAEKEGVSRNAVFEAKKELGLPPARKVTGDDGATHWVWWVPPDWSPPTIPP